MPYGGEKKTAASLGKRDSVAKKFWVRSSVPLKNRGKEIKRREAGGKNNVSVPYVKGIRWGEKLSSEVYLYVEGANGSPRDMSSESNISSGFFVGYPKSLFPQSSLSPLASLSTCLHPKKLSSKILLNSV